MIQLFVPLAVPDTPLELDHVTEATPTLSCAVPWTTKELSEVETLVLAGDKIVMDGGVVSGPGGGVVGFGFTGVGFTGVGLTGVGLGGVELGNGLRVIVRLRVTRLCCESRAETVTTVSPMFNGTAGIVQATDPCAVPEDPLFVVQPTCTVPPPPDVLPLMVTEDAVVGLAGA